MKKPHQITLLQVTSVLTYLITEAELLLQKVSTLGSYKAPASPQIIKEVGHIIREATNKLFREASTKEIMKDLVKAVFTDLDLAEKAKA